MSSRESGRPGYEVLQVKYGDRVTKKSIVFHDFGSTGEPDVDQPMDYAFWVIRNEETIILVDTGYPIDDFDWLGEISRVPVPDGLALLGIDPDKVAIVIATHFHYDHVGHIHLFRNATIVAAQAEYDFWMRRLDENGLEGEFATLKNVTTIKRAHEEGRVLLVTEAAEVAPGLTVYPVGGHCPGQLLTLVHASKGPIILASDAIHLLEQVEKGWAFFAHTDLEEMHEALKFAADLSKRNGAAIIPGHDPRTVHDYPALEGPASHFVTVLG